MNGLSRAKRPAGGAACGAVGGGWARGAMSFFEMGGYAAYVWPAFGVAAAIMIALLVLSLRAMRAREAALKGLEAAARHERAAEGGEGEHDGGRNAPA